MGNKEFTWSNLITAQRSWNSLGYPIVTKLYTVSPFLPLIEPLIHQLLILLVSRSPTATFLLCGKSSGLATRDY